MYPYRVETPLPSISDVFRVLKGAYQFNSYIRRNKYISRAVNHIPVVGKYIAKPLRYIGYGKPKKQPVKKAVKKAKRKIHKKKSYKK